MPALPPPAPRPFLRRPWVVESLVFFGVLWQESLRLEWRTAHRVLPLPKSVTAFYYYQAGDFANGYVNAFLLDGLTDLARHWAARRRGGSVERQGLQAMLATVLSIVEAPEMMKVLLASPPATTLSNGTPISPSPPPTP